MSALFLRYVEALRDDPQAPPPPDLSADDAALARALVGAYPLPGPDDTRRARIWRRVQDQRQTTLSSPNGRFDYEENMMINAQPKQSTMTPRGAVLRGMWPLVAVAAACALILAGLWLLPPTDDGSGSGESAGAPLVADATGTTQAEISPTARLATLRPTVTATPVGMATLRPAQSTATALIANVTSTVQAQIPLTPTARLATLRPTPSLIVLPPTLMAPSPPPVSQSFTWGNYGALTLVSALDGVVLDEMVWSPDGAYLAIMEDETIRLLHVADMFDEAQVLAEHSATVTALAFSADGSLLVSGDQDGDILFWLMEMQAPIPLTIQGDEAITALRFDPTGTVLVVETATGVKLWAVPAE
jgi:hypothetical protein